MSKGSNKSVKKGIVRRKKGYWTREKLSEYIYDRKNKGLSIRTTDILEEEAGCIRAVYKRYGKWENFLKDIGIEEDKDPYKEKENVLKDLKKLIEENGCYTQESVRKENTRLVRGIKDLGGWKKVTKELEKRGFNLQEYKNGKGKYNRKR